MGADRQGRRAAPESRPEVSGTAIKTKKPGNHRAFFMTDLPSTCPGMLKRYPLKLENLILDTRMVSIKRHIRALQKDPITGSIAWGLIRNRQGEIIGIHSLSKKQPVRLAHLDGAHLYLNEAKVLATGYFWPLPRINKAHAQTSESPAWKVQRAYPRGTPKAQ